MEIKKIDNSTRNLVTEYIFENWGSLIIVSKGKIHRMNTIDGYIAVEDAEIKGLITFEISDGECEIVSLDSSMVNCGIGSKLIEKVILDAYNNRCERVWLITTNDNTHAIRYYQKRGFEMKALYINAVMESRKIKPQIPLLGDDGIPILHEIEFEKKLGQFTT